MSLYFVERNINKSLKLGVVVHILIPSRERQRQALEILCEFKSAVVYKASSRPTRITEETLSQKLIIINKQNKD